MPPYFTTTFEPIHNQDVHINAYNILTFTADKVQDSGVMPDSLPNSSGTKYRVSKHFLVPNGA
jgi:hypothetical protein